MLPFIWSMCVACALCVPDLCGQIMLRLMDFCYFISLIQVLALHWVLTSHSHSLLLYRQGISRFILVIYSWITITAKLVELKQQSLHLLSHWLDFTRAVVPVPGLR